MNPNYNIYHNYILLVLLVALAGCSSVKLNTGQVDYRPYIKEDGQDADHVDFRYYLASSKINLEKTDRIIRSGDSVGIKILQGFICDFTEIDSISDVAWEDWEELIPNLFESRLNRKKCKYSRLSTANHDTRGEIAVLASVFELGKGNKIEFYKSQIENESARIVYYDADVRETGQFLNMSNLPLYGPITYNGGPLFLRLFVLEIDTDEYGASNSLLSELARFGSVAYPPASPVLNVLQTIGQVFSNSNSNDLEFKFDMTFDGEDSLSSSNAPLLYGNYVFIRTDDRFEKIPWYIFKLNHKTGRLEYSCDVEFNYDDETLDCISKQLNKCEECLQLAKGGDKYKLLAKEGDEYKQSTYFTIKVTKNEKAFEYDVGQTLADFKIQPTADKSYFSSLTKTFKEFGKSVERKAIFDLLRSDLNKLTTWPPKKPEDALMAESIAKYICSDNLNYVQRTYILKKLGSIVKNRDLEVKNGEPKLLLLPQKVTLKNLNATCDSGDNKITAEELFMGFQSKQLDTAS